MDWCRSLIALLLCTFLSGYHAQEFYYFTAHPANVFIAGSELEVKMSCTAAPLQNQAWRYTWRLNNRYLTSQPIGNARFIGFNTNELTIRPQSSIHDITIFGNNNNFTCVATNNHGPITSNIARVLRIGKPYFQGNGLTNIRTTVVAGQSIMIRCRYTPFPEIPVTILWYYTNNRILLTTSADGRISIGVDGSVYFANLLVSDAAPYRCAVRPDEPINTNVAYYSGNTTLSITPRSCSGTLCDFGPEFHRTSTNIRGRSGSSVTLECIGKGRPTPSISWCSYNPNTQLCNNIQASSKYTFNQASTRLTINNLIPQDAGIYRCTARSSRGSVFANNNLQVDPILTWITRFTSMSASIEDTVTLPCVAYGSPPLTYTWYKNAILLPMTNSRFSMSTINGNLTIRNLNNDTGTYQCVVQDRYSNIGSGGFFEVKVFAARFTGQMPRQQIIQVGPSAQVVCPIDGGPKPTITYYFNGNQLNLLGSNKYQSLRTGNLLVRNVVAADGGNYTCRGRNRYNPNNQYVAGWATVHVYEATKILNGPTTRDFRIGSTVTIPCNVTADRRIVNAVTVTWQKNGQALQGSKYVVRNSYPNYALTINNAQIPESGNYTCTMTAVIAQVPGQSIVDTKTGIINFNAIPAAPRLTYARLINSSHLFLNWTFAAGNENNSPLKKFVIQFKSNFISTIRTLLEISNINQRSVIITPSPYMTYFLYVAAENGVGLSQRSNEWEVNNPNTAVPSDAPTNLYTIANLADLTRLTVVWTPLTGEQANAPGLRYVLRYRRSGTVNDFRPIEISNSNYTITGLTPRVRYDFNVRALNNIGPGTTFIDHIGCTCQEVPIGTPFNITVQVTNVNTIINWLQVPLHLQRGPIRTNKVRITRVTPFLRDTITINAGTSIVLYGLPINTNLTVAINGVNSVGEGPYSIAKSFRTSQFDTAHAPTLSNPVDADIANVTVTFRWTISGQPFYYQPQYRLANQVWRSGNNLTRQSTSVIFTGLLPNTAYQFKVNAIYFGGRNVSSNVLAVQTKNTTGRQAAPWYQQAWFIIIIVIACLALVIVIVVILCKGRKKAVPKGKKNPPIPPPPEINNEEYDSIKPSRPPLPHPQTETVPHGDDNLLDNDSIDSLEQYADLPGLSKFNEDGSFIGEYGDKDFDKHSQYNRDSVVEPAGSHYGTVRDDASYHTNHNTIDVNNSSTFSTFV